MQSYVVFCLLFAVFPLALSALTQFYKLLTGPRGATEYHLQMYREESRKSAITILIIDLTLLAMMAAFFLWVWR